MKIAYPNNPSEFVDAVEKFSKSKLNRKAELLRIYEEVLKNKNEAIFEDLAFTAKYIMGLLRIIKNRKMSPDINNIDQIKKDYSDNMDKIVNKIKDIISSAGEDLKLYFEQTYFELSQESFLNLNELLSDLEWTKLYMNHNKR
jgi:hypothetical protein